MALFVDCFFKLKNICPLLILRNRDALCLHYNFFDFVKKTYSHYSCYQRGLMSGRAIRPLHPTLPRAHTFDDTINTHPVLSHIKLERITDVQHYTIPTLLTKHTIVRVK